MDLTWAQLLTSPFQPNVVSFIQITWSHTINVIILKSFLLLLSLLCRLYWCDLLFSVCDSFFIVLCCSGWAVTATPINSRFSLCLYSLQIHGESNQMKGAAHLNRLSWSIAQVLQIFNKENSLVVNKRKRCGLVSSSSLLAFSLKSKPSVVIIKYLHESWMRFQTKHCWSSLRI